MRTPCRSLALLAGLAALLALAPGLAHARTIRLKFPKFTVPPHSDREVCTFVRMPTDKTYDASGQLILNLGGSRHFATHHFLMYAYTGKDMDEFDGFEGKIVDSKACLDFGPTDRNTRLLLGGAQQPKLSTRLPLGLAQQITPNTDSKGKAIGFILNSHWINGDDKPHRAAVRVKFFQARKHTVKRYLQPIFEVVANGFIKVPPNSTSNTAAWFWAPGGPDFGAGQGGVPIPKGPACVTSVTAHMHKRGKDFAVDFAPGGGAPIERIFEATDYTDPGQRIFDPPLLVSPGQRINYRCTHDNGMTTALKLGCEEQPGVTPGLSILEAFGAGRGLFGTPKDCHQQGPNPTECPPTDPAFPNITFTGNCVPANLVFGFTSDDDMCILPGSYYDANVGAAPGAECDLGPLPIIN
jgi:hypothetical protein